MGAVTERLKGLGFESSLFTGPRAERVGVEGKSEKDGDLEHLDDIESARTPGFERSRSKGC